VAAHHQEFGQVLHFVRAEFGGGEYDRPYYEEDPGSVYYTEGAGFDQAVGAIHSCASGVEGVE
jgi:hypothetical protein